jgi:hypothetical protein
MTEIITGFSQFCSTFEREASKMKLKLSSRCLSTKHQVCRRCESKAPRSLDSDTKLNVWSASGSDGLNPGQNSPGTHWTRGVGLNVATNRTKNAQPYPDSNPYCLAHGQSLYNLCITGSHEHVHSLHSVDPK